VNESDLKEDPIPEKNVVMNPYYQGSSYVKLVMSSQKKRKTVGTHKDSDRPQKKRLRAREPVVKSSELVCVTPANSKVVDTSAAKVGQPKEGVSEGRLNHMRKNGCTQEEFIKVVQKFGLPEVMKSVAGKDSGDQKQLRNRLASVAYNTVKYQAARFAVLSNPVNDK
jgi:hypothetical protein